jgi:hypothetical protein
MAKYDPQVIVQFADDLYKQAGSMAATYAVLGALVGFGIGAAVLSGLGGALIGGALGALLLGGLAFKVGQQRAFALRLQAQVALCQVQIEANTRGVGASGAERTA